jgi:uncharacterized membrane-anchored protein YitT (DUF2179 family)
MKNVSIFLLVIGWYSFEQSIIKYIIEINFTSFFLILMWATKKTKNIDEVHNIFLLDSPGLAQVLRG